MWRGLNTLCENLMGFKNDRYLSVYRTKAKCSPPALGRLQHLHVVYSKMC